MKNYVNKNYLKKLFFQNILAFIDLFYRNIYTRYFICSDCMGHHVSTICNEILLKKIKGHTRIPGLSTQELDAGLWTLDAGLWTLDSRRWTPDTGR